MTLLVIGLILWFATHLFSIWMAPQRDVLVARFGVGVFKVAAAVATVLAVVVMVLGYQATPYVEVWAPPAFLNHINNLLMLAAIGFFIAGSIPSPVRRKIRHPQLIGMKTWALAHLLVNGDLASIVLFGGLIAWAVLAMIGSNRRDGPRGTLPEVSKIGWPMHILASITVFWVVAWLHLSLGGVSPFPG
ncbi:MAG: NnrU family protein [Paracoccaceae bacterium]